MAVFTADFRGIALVCEPIQPSHIRYAKGLRFMRSLDNLSVAELLGLHVGISEQLRSRGIVRGENVPTGDLAEFLFCRSYEWTQANNSEKAFDAKDGEGKRYQIKGRRIHQRTNSRQLSAIRDLEGLDILAAVLFDHDYRVLRAALIPNEVVRKRSKHVTHDNKWQFMLTDDVWNEESVKDVTGVLKDTWNQHCSVEPTEGSLCNHTSVRMRKVEKNFEVKAVDKRSAMERINSALGNVLLNHDNTHFSNVNASKPVWWFNIDPCKFENDLHLLCAKNSGLIWLKIEANIFRSPERTFRFRSDKGLVDLEISCGGERYMHDVKSGGSGYDFRPHIQREWS